jgi:hypothetical protein
MVLNLFYEEPEDDRWLSFDRYPRRIIRRLVRGSPQPGGQRRVFINLCLGLDRIGVHYRVNDYRFARRNPEALACIIGKPCVLDAMPWKNPILFGAAIYSHPLDDPQLIDRLPVKQVLVPGPWMAQMCSPWWGQRVTAWPVGIDTNLWQSEIVDEKIYDVLLYDKVRWEHDRFDASLIDPIRSKLRLAGRSVVEMRYGYYRDLDFRSLLKKSRSMVFLCEHETQGIAYQQALSCGVPIFAWDRGGFWKDPAYYPQKVKFEGVTSVPYWDDRCGRRFANTAEFEAGWDDFWDGVQTRAFAPRAYILENLTLEKCARDYVGFARRLGADVPAQRRQSYDTL